MTHVASGFTIYHRLTRMPNSPSYYVREPSGKRPAPIRDVTDEPRAKRRFEKVNTLLGEFSISNDIPSSVSIESSSSDEDMIDAEIEDNEPTTSVVVQEPDDNPCIQLDPSLKQYLYDVQNSPLIPAMHQKIVGNELILWRPNRPPPNPFDDPTMSGRITEIEDEWDEGEPEPAAHVSSPSESSCTDDSDEHATPSAEIAEIDLSSNSSPQSSSDDEEMLID